MVLIRPPCLMLWQNLRAQVRSWTRKLTPRRGSNGSPSPEETCSSKILGIPRWGGRHSFPVMCSMYHVSYISEPPHVAMSLAGNHQGHMSVPVGHTVRYWHRQGQGNPSMGERRAGPDLAPFHFQSIIIRSGLKLQPCMDMTTAGQTCDEVMLAVCLFLSVTLILCQERLPQCVNICLALNISPFLLWRQCSKLSCIRLHLRGVRPTSLS